MRLDEEETSLRVRLESAHDLGSLDARLSEFAWDLVVIQARADDVEPVEAVCMIKSRRPDCPVVMVAAVDHLEIVLEARHQGLDEYVVRTPCEEVFAGLLNDALGRALARRPRRSTGRFDKHLWSFFAAAPIGMDVLDLDGNIIQANAALEEFLGYSCQELTGRTFSDFTVDEESQEALDLVDALIAGERAGYGHVSDHPQRYFVVDRRYRRADGSIRWANLVRLLLHDEDGSPRVVVGMMVDITERKRAEGALKQSEALKQAILDTAIDAIISIDERGIVQSFNQAAEEMFGYPKAEIVGQKVNVLMPSPHREHHDHYLERYFRTGERRIIGIGREVEGRRKDGTTFPLSLGVAEANVGGRRLFTGVLRDLSEKKAMERQLRQAEKMKAVGQLAGGVAHDFNNLLMVVNSYSMLLAKRIEDGSSLAPLVDKIQDAVDRGERLTRQLLAFSPQQVVHLQLLNLNDKIADMEEFLGRVIEEDISVDLDLASDMGPVKADVGHLEQILMNLVVNARDAMPSGGQLEIRTSDEEIRGEHTWGLEEGRYAVLQVEDTGHGMDENVRSRIFEPFFTTKGRDKGTGLGLATVYGIVRRYNGHIDVDSEPGRGSLFTIRLPVAKTDETRQQAKDPSGQPSDAEVSETILLVEDEDDIRMPLRLALENLGYVVLEASSGEEAVQISREYRERIHLLLSDVVLPGMSGVDLADELDEMIPGIETIFISGYAGDVLERKNLEPGRVILSKPFDISELTSCVSDLLGR